MRLPESPYTFVRTRVMRTLLIPKSEYQKLVRMSLSEVINYLGRTQYGKEVNELGLRFSGIELVEQALDKNFRNTIQKLKHISPEAYNKLIDAYMLRYDIENLKTILRAKEAGLKDVKRLFLPESVLPPAKLESLMEKHNIHEIFKSLPTPLDALNDKLAKKKDMTKIEIETMLDHFYFNYILDFAGKIPREGRLFKEFLTSMIEVTNMITYLRLHREKFSPAEIKKYIFPTKRTTLFDRLLNAKTKEEIVEAVKNSRYAQIAELIGEDKSLIPVEISLNQILYHETFTFQRQNPLSVYVVLAYLFAKETEIINLKKIIKSKFLGVEPEKVEKQLVAL